MKVSILISSFNKGRFIKECIESCLAQEDENLEIILFDNNSNDETDKVLADYQKKIKICKRERISNFPSINQIDLLEKAYKISNGEIICLLDADDYFIKKKIKFVRNFFKENIEIDVLFNLPLIQKGEKLTKFKLKRKLINNIWETIIPTSSICFKSSFFEECIKRNIFKNFDFLEIDFRLNVFSKNLKKKFAILDEPLNIYRYVENGIMSQNKKYSLNWWKKRLQAHEFMKNIYSENNKDYKNLDFSITKILVNFFKIFKS